MSDSRYCGASLTNLKNQQNPGLRDHRFGPLYLVYPVLDALGIKSPTGRHGNVLLAIDFKGRGSAIWLVTYNASLPRRASNTRHHAYLLSPGNAEEHVICLTRP